MITKVIRKRDPDDLRSGLIYGILAGLAFAVTAWGFDAFRLANASAGFPWLKFLIGALTCGLIGGLAGWLTALADNSLVGAIVWLFTGIAFAWIASHIPFEIMTLALNRLDPRLQDIQYPYPENMQQRMVVVYILVVLCSTLAGGLQAVVVESARRASTGFMHAVTLAIVIPFFALAGVVAADYISQPFSTAIIAVDDLLQFHQQLNGQQPSPQQIREKHYRALAAIQDLADKPYRLFLSSIEPEYLDFSTILIDFDGQWAECSVVINSVSVCKPGKAFSQPTPTSAPAATPAPTPSALPPAAEPAEATTSPLPPQSPALTPGPVSILQGEASENLVGAPQYTLSLNLDYDNLRIEGKAIVDYTNIENVALDRLYFRLIPNGKGSYGNGRLDITQAAINGQPVQFKLSNEDTVLELPLAESLQPGEKAQIEMNFTGQVPQDFGGSAEPAGYGIYNFTDGVLALSGWYPILAVHDDQGWNLDLPSEIGDSVYSDMALYDVNVSLPKELVVAASGVQIESLEDGGQKRLHFETGPMRDFFLIMSPDFEITSRTVDGVAVNMYSLPGHEAAARKGLDIAADSLSIYNEKFGAYPYTELDVVDAPMRNASGVEFPGIVLVAEKLFGTPENPSFAVATAHEVAHQWWYNVIGNDVFDDPWLDEALTTYSSSLYYEVSQGRNAAEGLIGYWENRYQDLKEKGLDDQIARPLSYFEGLDNPGVYGGVVYSKGALFFDALRQEIGDQAFFEALQTYYRQNKFAIARPADLLETFEAAAGRQLDDFYQGWLHTP